MEYRKGSILAIIAETTGKDQLAFVLAVLKSKMLVEFLLYVMEKKEELAERIGRENAGRHVGIDSKDEAKVFIDSLRDIVDESVLVDANYLHEEVYCGEVWGTKHRYALFTHIIVHKLTFRMFALVAVDSSFADLSDEDLLLHLRGEFDEEIRITEKERR